MSVGTNYPREVGRCLAYRQYLERVSSTPWTKGSILRVTHPTENTFYVNDILFSTTHQVTFNHDGTYTETLVCDRFTASSEIYLYNTVDKGIPNKVKAIPDNIGDIE